MTTQPSKAELIDDLMVARMDEVRVMIEGGWEPVVVEGKRPVAPGWQKGECSLDRYRSELLQSGAMNIGVRTGRVVGVDIDVVDKDHVEKIKALAFATLGTTGFVRFGAKGAMLVYRTSQPLGKIRISTSGQAAVEILGAGQQFVAFGIHPDTHRPYAWDTEGLYDPLSAPVDDLPEMTPAKLRDYAQKLVPLLAELGYGGARVTGDVEVVVEPAAPSLAKGDPVSVEELESVLRFLDPNARRDEWVKDIAAIRATPGIDVEDLREITLRYSRGEYHGTTPSLYTGDADVNAAFNTLPPRGDGVHYGTLKAKARAKGWRDDPRTGEEVFGPVVEKLKREAANDDDAEPEDEPEVADESWRELVARFRGQSPAEDAELPEIEFFDEHKLYARTADGAVGLLYGPYGSGKSALTVSDLMRMIRAHLDDPEHVKPVRVAYGIGEGRHGIRKNRVPAVAKALGIDLDTLRKFWRTIDLPDLTNNRHVKAYTVALSDLFDGQPPDICVIDTLHSSSGGIDENSDAIGKLLGSGGAVGAIRRKLGGPMVLVIDHTGKDVTKGARGHSSKGGDVDFLIEVRFDKDARRIVAWLEKQRDGEDHFEVEYSVTPAGQVPVATPIGRVDVQQGKARKQATSLARSVLNCLSWFSEWTRGRTCEVTTGDLAKALMRSKAWTEPVLPGAGAPEIVLQAPLSAQEVEAKKGLQRDLARLARRWRKAGDYKAIIRKDETSDEWTFKAHEAARLQNALADEREGKR